ncbi:transposable element Tcb2 transposase [Trichonephila clavipes]|uniref:Transposable element Tcb2 transposase n=1 Tax=Trichonephila clavipes TaxID=2585209 RepID=A0A8X6UYX4_TRICX|nr:transposable element Tcb2 transposase [Trichonephila clavipes]
MSSRHHIDDFMRGRIIGKIEEGRKITDVSREFDIAHSVVSRLWKSFKTTGMCRRRHGGGRVRRTTPAEDRYIVLSVKRNRSTTAQEVANQFLTASGKQISRKTVARRLRGGGLYARRPVVCVSLTRQHCTARLQWCREHHNWTEQDWACVLFSDESRFNLSSDCRRQLIWRESGTASRPENIQEKDRYPTCSIMVWVGIMINGRTRLHVVANGTMTGQRYIDEVLLPHVRLFRGAVGDKFVFMDDNATCHRTLAVQDCLDSEGIQRLVWPARSPDLNPIENVWDDLGRQVAGRNYLPTNKNTLIRALTEEWDKLTQQLLDNVVQNICAKHGDKSISDYIGLKKYPHALWKPSDQPAPLQFSLGIVKEKWQKWRQELENYLLTTEKDDRTDKIQMAILLNLLGSEGLEICNTFKLELKANFSEVLQKSEEYCSPRRNVVYERYKFFSCVQLEDQALETYVTQLKILASTCEFAEQENGLI